MSRPNSKTALVTGAAARIGAAITRELHARGCRVLMHYNSSREPAQQLADELNAIRADSATLLQADLACASELDALVAQVQEQCGSLDILVNNASRFYPTDTGDTLAWQWDDLMQSNLRGPYFLIQGLLQELRTAAGSVVNILDVHARKPMAGHTVYCISKAGLEMMTLSLAMELGPEIRVNGVSPGAILWPEHELDHGDAQKQDILSRTALKRIGKASDIATAVAYLSLDAPYVTGQVLAIDGGRSLNM